MDRENMDSPTAPGVRIRRRTVIRAASGAALAGVGAAALGLGEYWPANPDGTAVAQPRLRLVGNVSPLLIEDGSPHWLSPDIWVVPGADPNGPAGQPVAGETAYVWARVTNTGTIEAADAQVRFYWGDPSTQLHYSTMNLIGSAFVTIAAGASQEVLCLTPWNVTIVNNGHECLVVNAQLAGDAPLPDEVDVMDYPNVGQRNLTVVSKLRPDGQVRWQAFTVPAPPTAAARVRLTAAVGGAVTAATLASLGLPQRVAVTAPVVTAGLARAPMPGGSVGSAELAMTVPAGQRASVFIGLRATGLLGAGEYQLVTVTQHEGGNVVGGISFVVTAD